MTIAFTKNASRIWERIKPFLKQPDTTRANVIKYGDIRDSNSCNVIHKDNRIDRFELIEQLTRIPHALLKKSLMGQFQNLRSTLIKDEIERLKKEKTPLAQRRLVRLYNYLGQSHEISRLTSETGYCKIPNSIKRLSRQQKNQCSCLFLYEAQKYLESSKLERARSLTKKAMLFNNRSDYALHMMGSVEFGNYNYRKAADWFQRALNLNPNFIPSLGDFAVLLRTAKIRLGPGIEKKLILPDRAFVSILKEGILKTTLQKNPKLARLYSRSKPLAQHLYFRMLNIDPYNPYTLYALGMLAFIENNRPLLKVIATVYLQQVEPSHPIGWDFEGALMEQFGKYKKALQAYQIAHRKAPQNAKYLICIGNIHLFLADEAQHRADELDRTKNIQLARTYLLKAANIDRKTTLPYLIKYFTVIGRLDETKKLYAEIRSYKDFSSKLTYGFHLLEQKKLNVAEAHFTELINGHPDMDGGHIGLGIALTLKANKHRSLCFKLIAQVQGLANKHKAAKNPRIKRTIIQTVKRILNRVKREFELCQRYYIRANATLSNASKKHPYSSMIILNLATSYQLLARTRLEYALYGPDKLSDGQREYLIMMHLQTLKNGLYYYVKVSRFDKNNTRMLIGKASLLMYLRYFKEAISSYDRILKQYPYHFEAIIGKIHALFHSGKYDEAEKLINERQSKFSGEQHNKLQQALETIRNARRPKATL